MNLIAQCKSKKHVLQHMSQIISLDKKDLFQSLTASLKQIKCQLVYYGVFINIFYIYIYIYIIIKIPAMLVFSVINNG